MVLSEEEKKERHRLANKKYYEKQKMKAKQGNTKAAKQKERTKYKTYFSHTRQFILNKAKKSDLPLLRDMIATRQKELNKSSKKS